MPYTIGAKGSYGCSGYPVIKEGTTDVMGCHETRESAGKQIAAIEANENKFIDELTPPQPRRSTRGGPGSPSAGAITSSGGSLSTKMDEEIQEGDYVMGMTSEGIAHGRVEHIMWEGGILGEEGTPYSLESMPPENPAMSVRVYEQEDEGYWTPTAYSIGMMYQDAQKLPSLEGHSMPDEMQDEMIEMSKQLWASTFDPRSVKNNAKISKLWH